MRLPAVDLDERYKSFDPDGLVLLLTKILAPWPCPGCRYAWLRRYAPRSAAFISGLFNPPDHRYGRGCAMRSYRVA